MTFKALFRIEPASYFGLPEGDKTVIPAQAGDIVGSSFDTRSGKLVSYGTLSRYREDAEKVQLTVESKGALLEVSDNFFELTFDHDDARTAVLEAVRRVEIFLRHLMVEQGDFFTFEFLQVEEVGGNVTPDPVPQPITLARVTAYNLPELKNRITRAAERSNFHDQRLDKALLYYEHARLLYNLRGHVPLLSVHANLLVGSAYLNLWKALTTLLGEPGTDSDYQRRFKEFGFPKNFWRESVAPLKTVRDQADVAHYALSADTARAAQDSFGAADKVCRDVVMRYADHLAGEVEEGKSESRDVDAQ